MTFFICDISLSAFFHVLSQRLKRALSSTVSSLLLQTYQIASTLSVIGLLPNDEEAPLIVKLICLKKQKTPTVST